MYYMDLALIRYYELPTAVYRRWGPKTLGSKGMLVLL